MGIQSFPGVLLFWKLSKMSVHSSKVILPSQDNLSSSESLGMFKSFKNDSVFD